MAMSALPGFVYPGDVSASKRYWKHDIVEPAIEITERSTIKVPSMPGIGFDVNDERLRELTVAKEVWQI
jgi:O-succinylbenzoate synthase